MYLLLYVHVCVTRTGWKTRPRPKTVILPIKKSNLLAFIFSHTFHLIRMEFDIVMKQFKCNILRPHLSKIYWSKGKKLLFYRLHQ